MLIVIGTASVRPDRRGEFVDSARTVVAASRVEDGCRAYGFFADLTDEDTVMSLEVWRDQAALDAHMARPHTQSFLAAVTDLVEGPPTTAVHHVVPSSSNSPSAGQSSPKENP